MLAGQTRRVEKSWFWIALLSLTNLSYTCGGTCVYFSKATEIEAHPQYEPLSIFFIYIAAAVGIFIVPLLLRRLGVFDSARRFKTVFLILSGAGIASMVLFSIVCNTIVPEIVWPAFVLQYAAVLIVGTTTGCALHRMIRIIGIKSAAWFSGLWLIATYCLTLVNVSILGSIYEWRAYEVSFLVVFAGLLLAPALLLLINKDSFTQDAPKAASYFPESLFPKFMVLAVIVTALLAFYDDSYYGGGDYEGFSLLLIYSAFLLPIVVAVFIILLLRRGKWLTVTLAIALLMCFQQGLILFFNNNESLASAYLLMDTFSSNSAAILVFIPLAYCVQRRKSAAAIAGIFALYFIETAVTYLASESPGHAYSAFVAPAVAFTLSIVTVAYMFYLGGEHSRLQSREIAEEFRRRLEAEKLSADEAMQKAGFTPEERDVALLLIEGKTRTEITRGLRLTAAEADRRINAIRDKINHMGGPDPIAAAVDAYKLTRRETDMLRCLRRGMTNAEIASELFLSEETVKGHVRNLLNKMELSSRNDVTLWAEAFNTSGGAAK